MRRRRYTGRCPRLSVNLLEAVNGEEESLEQRQLGRTDTTISAIGLGCVTFGREIDQETCFRIMDYALEKGITFFDTAEGYGGGQAREGRRRSLGVDDVREVSGEMSSSEHIIGRWLRSRGCRDQVTLCTKVSSGASAENVTAGLNSSLERLATDNVDIYKIHSPDAETPIMETLDALTVEVGAARIGVIGCSNYSAAQLQEALEASKSAGYARFEITQPIYNLVQRGGEAELFPLCKREEVSVSTYSPLGAGFLAGKYTPDRDKFPDESRFHVSPGHADIYFSERNFGTVELLREEASELGLPMVRLAMAWAMSNPDVTAVLVGARSTDHIDNALAAFDMGLDPDLRAEMSAWSE